MDMLMYNTLANDMQEDTVDGYISVKDAAAKIGVDPSAIRHRILRKTIKNAIKVGSEYRGEWFIPIEEVDKLQRSLAGKPPKSGGVVKP